ncbi:MAG TPA: aldehyde dehydrogenase family protein [Candidatus Acidoferrum sp.]|nr:aldehyde dehydrogenase family protein [Candidatus Acidoferrum sp.]
MARAEKASGETIAEILSADQNDLDEACRSAATSQPSWAAALSHDRAEIVGWLIRESASTRLKAETDW